MKPIIIWAFLLGLLSSCEIPCPGFYEDNEYYATPYSFGDSIVFTDSNDTIKFKVEDFYQTPPTSLKGFLMERECGTESRFKTNSEPRFGYQMFEHYGNWYDYNFPLKYWVIKLVVEDSFTVDPSSKSSYNDRTQISFYEQITIDSTEYFNVYDLQLDTNTQSEVQVFRLLRNNDAGVIQFYDRMFNKKWTLLK